ncbi:hypothetical protein JOC34_000563 [Virgibacillus halotolerans]|uniref:hypothetical protein n=1 Tax=Virgibacillus halotolerans TaxID=1071053 RepID=UPI00195F45EA|nr:hypothetical protein [Virgibacillus halotolerans]MBM7598206.1 hypothetical protein [Virgibacillus halotolerans]
MLDFKIVSDFEGTLKMLGKSIDNEDDEALSLAIMLEGEFGYIIRDQIDTTNDDDRFFISATLNTFNNLLNAVNDRKVADVIERIRDGIVDIIKGEELM